MGITNDADTACGQPLLKFENTQANFTFCHGCKKAATQHLIRVQAQPGYASMTGWPKLEQVLYLVRPDGESHSDRFNRIVYAKAKSWVDRRQGDLKKAGICWDSYDKTERGYSLVYAPWSRAFLHEQWDGQDFSERGATLLLEKYGEPPMDDVVSRYPATENDALVPSDSISNAGDDAPLSMDECDEKLQDGTAQLITMNKIILTLYYLLLEGVEPKEEQEIMDALQQELANRKLLAKEMKETEEAFDNALRQAFGLGPEVRYPDTGLWDKLINSVVLFPEAVGRKKM